MTKEEQLFELCRKFIDDNDIYCEYTVHDSDNVIVNAYSFIEQICDIVGYKEFKE